MALIAIVFDSTYVDQDNLPVVTSGTSQCSGSSLYAESSWDRVALTGRGSSSSAFLLDLNHTEAKKGRGYPKIIKLRTSNHYLIQYLYYVVEWS